MGKNLKHHNGPCLLPTVRYLVGGISALNKKSAKTRDKSCTESRIYTSFCVSSRLNPLLQQTNTITRLSSKDPKFFWVFNILSNSESLRTSRNCWGRPPSQNFDGSNSSGDELNGKGRFARVCWGSEGCATSCACAF